MINNIGFTDNSTHTSQAPHPKLSNMRIYNLKTQNGNLRGKLKINRLYELKNVACYWKGIHFNYIVLLNESITYIKVRFKKAVGF